MLQAPDSKKPECAPILETVTEGEVQRLEGLVESGWIGDSVRLKFDPKDAKIYSIRLTDERVVRNVRGCRPVVPGLNVRSPGANMKSQVSLSAMGIRATNIELCDGVRNA